MPSDFALLLQTTFPQAKLNEPLSNHCLYRIGGNADYFYELKNTSEIPELISIAKKNEIPFLIIGRGSNILFPDEGYKGLIIKNLSNGLGMSGTFIRADSGVLLSEIIDFGLKHNLCGLEEIYGLPGTIGGAVFGNAGSFELFANNFIERVEYFDFNEESVKTIENKDLEFEYKTSFFKKNPHHIILRAVIRMKLLKGHEKEIKEKMENISKKRWEKQPPGLSCGSFFKNKILPNGEIFYAGKMIEDCGLKGYKIGAAQISDRHANFIINLGSASSKDIIALKDLIQEKVKENFGIELEEEVRIIDDRQS